uniref:ANK_REP_REGION domain-containing protein n=1 Tax=Trichobilharzia regenti TaxID=157069 RepID=A0AA85JB19_TRIRE|nr:unnamed protein product [Trichobilharzia regenti]
MRDERKKTRDTEGSDKRDNRRSLSIRDVSLVRLARNGDLDSVKQMIKDGANVNEQDESGWTALHEVCMRNVPRMVEYLLRHGSDPGIVNVNGDTALHCAVRIGSLRTVRALLYYNANPLISNHKGDKPLDLCQDSEVSSFLKQHIDNNQLNMVSSSGHGKFKVSRQHSTTSHSTKHLTCSSSSVEHYTGSKDNNSLTSISDDVYSDSDGHDDNGNENDGDADDDGYSNLGVNKSTTHLSHNHNMISPTNSHHSDMMNNLSSSGQYSHQTSSSSPSVLSSVQKCMPDMHNSTKSSKKDPYAFEDDENDDTVNSSANTLLHSSVVSSGQIGIHSNCNSSGGGGGAGFIGTVTSTRSNITNTSPNNSGNSLLSKQSRQISSSNLSTVVESGNTSSDSNHSYNTTGGPPLRLRFAKEAGQYTLMEQQQQQQVDLSSLSNCDMNSSGGTNEVSNFNSMNDNNTSGGSSNNNNNIASHLDSNTNIIDNRNDQDVGLLVSMRSEQLTGQEISTSCQSESSGGEESSQKVPPLRIKFASGTSGDNESSVTSLSASVSAPSGYSIHLNNSDSHNNNDNNGLENNTNDEVDRKDKFDIKSRLSVDDVSRSDGKELAASVSANTLNTIITSSTSEKEKVDRSRDHGLSHHSKTHRSHSHNTTVNPNTPQHPVDSSTSLSTSSSPVPTTCSTPTTTTVNSTGNSGVVSSTGTGGSSRSKAESTQEANNSHANSTSSSRTTNSNRETGKETHRHRSGRTLRSHTAAQREKEEKERHTDDTSPIKKRKLRSRSDASSHDSNTTTNNNSNSQNRGNTAGGNDNSSSAVTTTHSGSTPTSSVSSSTNTAVVNTEVSNDLPLTSSTTIPQVDTPMTNEEKKPPVVNTQTVITDEDTDVPMPDVSELEQKPVSMDVDVKSETCGSPASVATLSMDTTTNMDVQVPSTITPPSLSSSVSITTTPAVTMPTASVEQSGGCQGEADTNVDYLLCPAGPGDEDRKDIELLKFQNPYEKAAELNKGLRELVKNLVKVHPKAPCGYQDYLLVTRNYLLAGQPSFATYMKRLPPGNLEPAFVELFNEQEEERYAQALKHQSEREHLQLGAEQAVLRAQTRGALAVANQSKPYSFCSILSYNDLTYIPPVGKEDNREEETVRGRFTPGTFIGWLHDIIDTYQSEKKKLLCRQLHEAESLMMVQKLDWEMKARETLANVDCIGLDVFKDIPGSCVPMIPVPNDFPLFARDPVHRPTSMTMTSNNNNTGGGGNPIPATTTSTVMNSISAPAIKTTAPTNTVSSTTSNP